MHLQDFSTLFDNRKHLLFNLLLNMRVNFLLLIHNWLSWVTYIQKVARFIIGRNDPFNKILQIIIIEAIKQQIPEIVLWRPSRQYLRRKSRDKKRQVNSPVCALCCQFLWIVHFSLPLRCSPMFICPVSCVRYVASFSGLSISRMSVEMILSTKYYK
jgi:hypothetical protein